MAVNLARQQGLQFNSAKDAQNHLSRNKKEIHVHLQPGDAAVVEGLKALQEKNCGYVHGYVSHMCGRLLKRMDSSKKIKGTIDEILHFDGAVIYFIAVVKGFLNSEYFKQEFTSSLY